MSTQAKTPETSSAPKNSKIAQKLNSLKPSNLSDEKKEALRRIYYIGGFATGVLTTVTAIVVKSYYNSVDATNESAEGDETSESESND